VSTRTAKIGELTPDTRNANKGTVRGLALLDKSLRQYGAGRSILVDKHGRVIAGNKTLERYADIGLDDVLVVETDGRQLVAVQRTDLDLETDPKARELAYSDNRSGELDLDWDVEQIAADLEAGVDLAGLWSDGELASLISAQAGGDWADAMAGLPGEDRAPFQQMTFTVSDDQAEIVKAALSKAQHIAPFVDTGNENSNGNALARICEAYVG
jgi:hypothetical protein